MKIGRSKKYAKVLCALLIVEVMCWLSVAPYLMAQQQPNLRVIARPDPLNPKRPTLALPKVFRRVPVIRLRANLLETTRAARHSIPFKPFEMVNPRTRKPLDPNTKITLPDKRVVTVKQFYDQANSIEEQLNKRGYSLRSDDTFDRVVIPRQPVIYNVVNKPGAITFAGNYISSITAPGLYVDLDGAGGGTEFPTQWSGSTLQDQHRTKFGLLVETPNGNAPSIKKFVWQISATPFPATADPLAANVMRSGEVPADWTWIDNSSLMLGNNNKAKNKYARVVVDFSDFGQPPQNKTVPHYVRVVAVGQLAGQTATTNAVVVNYGSGPQAPIKIIAPVQEINSSPAGESKFEFPGGSSPFSIYFTRNSVSGTLAKLDDKITGVKAMAGAGMGVRYFNFDNLINSDAPVSLDKDLFEVHFRAVAGKGTGPNNQNEKEEVKLIFNILGVETEVPLTQTGFDPVTASASYAYKNDNTIDEQLLLIVIPLGPLDITVDVKLTGNYGFELGTAVSLPNMHVDGMLKLYLNTNLLASGGVSLPLDIAFAKVKADFTPLFNAQSMFTFNSDDRSIKLVSSYSALKGSASLSAGFYHPCPPVKQVKKLWGYISGDSDLPLCQTTWDYPIYSLDGKSDSFTYSK